MVFLFAAITYIDMVKRDDIKYFRANHNSVVDTLIGSINLYPESDTEITELKKLITKVHTYLYENNENYRKIIDAYIMGKKREAERVGILTSEYDASTDTGDIARKLTPKVNKLAFSPKRLSKKTPK